jgi:hypothetical protein
MEVTQLWGMKAHRLKFSGLLPDQSAYSPRLGPDLWTDRASVEGDPWQGRTFQPPTPISCLDLSEQRDMWPCANMALLDLSHYG